MALRRNRSTASGALGRSNSHSRNTHNVLPTNADLPSLTDEFGTDEFGIVYCAFNDLDFKEGGLMKFLSKEVRKNVLSTKIGAIKFDSYPGRSVGTRHMRRLTSLDCGNIFIRKMKPHYTSPRCEFICEALIHSVFTTLGQDITEHSKEFFYISEDQRNYIGTFFTSSGCMKIPWKELKDVSPSSDDGRRIIRRAMACNKSEISELRRLGRAHLQQEEEYTPTHSSLDTGTRLNQFFTRSFDDLSRGRTHENIFVFRLNSLDAVLRRRLQRIRNAFYITRVVISDEANLTHQDRLFITRHKMGMIGMDDDHGNDPIGRLDQLQVGSPFELEMIVFELSSKEEARGVEALYHAEFKLCRYKNEIFYLLLPDAQSVYNELYNFLSNNGPSRLRDLTESNHLERLTDLVTRDSRLWTLDAALRSIIPLNEIELPVLRANRKTSSLIDNYPTYGLSVKPRQWTVLIWRLVSLAMDNRNMAGRDLLSMLLQDEFLGINIGRGYDFVIKQIRTWFPIVLRIEMKDFMESNDVGNLICAQLSMTGYGTNLAHLQLEGLHPKWPFLVSNGNEISIYRGNNRRGTDVV